MKIELYRRIGDYIYCEDDTNNAYKIEIADLEKFLDANDCLDWSVNYADSNGDTQELSGKMSIHEWLDSKYVNIDLTAYLQLQQANQDHEKIMIKIDELISEIKNLKP